MQRRKGENTYGVVSCVSVNRRSNSFVGRLDREVLSTETWSLETLGLDVGERANRSEGDSELMNFSVDRLDVEVNHALGHGSEFDLTIVGRNHLSARVSRVKAEILMVINKGEGEGGKCTLEHLL